MTRNGTEKSTTNPWNIDSTVNSFPLQRLIIGRVVSIVVAPPAEIGARLPNHLTSSGAHRRVVISLIMLDSRATVPNPAPLYCVMNMLERE